MTFVGRREHVSALTGGVGLAVVAICSVIVVTLLAGCGGSSSSTSSTSASASSPTRGGVLRIAGEENTNLDPAVNLNSTDYAIDEAVYDYLVDLDQKARPVPSLATSWSSNPGATTWTFNLRQGVVFHNGAPFVAADVVYTMNRIMDPKVGAASYENFKNVKSVTAIDDHTVQFVLKEPSPEFPVMLAEIHEAILPTSLKDPAKEAIGTGPFALKSIAAGDRAVLVTNKQYWRKDANGQSLPYLDGLQIVFSPDVGGQVEALQAGEFDFVGGLTSALIKTLEGNPNFRILTNVTNSHYAISLRSDRSPTKDVRVRMALRLGTDTVSLAKIVRPDYSDPGNGTMIGPLYADYYLNQPPPYDPAKAKQLLAEAGYPNGFSLTLYVQTYIDCPAIATVWKAQMAKIGVKVNIKELPPDTWYGDGQESWLKVDYGIIDWATRFPPLLSFQLAYVSTGAWNAPHWSNPQFDAVCNQIAVEPDAAKRAELYKEAQRILLQQNPEIITYFEKAACATPTNVHGITIAPDWSYTRFTTAYKTK